ncbi:MAG: hypothetical protein AAFY08_14380 [Planctomycetota bacterium]
MKLPMLWVLLLTGFVAAEPPASIDALVEQQIDAAFVERETVWSNYPHSGVPKTRLGWCMPLPDGRLLIAGMNLPYVGQIGFELASGEVVPSAWKPKRDDWLVMQENTVLVSHKSLQVHDVPDGAVAVVYRDQSLAIPDLGAVRHRIENQTLYGGLPEPLVGGPVLIDNVVVASGEVRIHQADFVIVRNATFTGAVGTGSLEVRGCRFVLLLNCTFIATPGGPVFHQWPKHPTEHVALWNVNIVDTVGRNRTEAVLLESGPNPYRDFAFVQIRGHDAGAFSIWQATLEDATFSGVELPTRFTLGPNAELWGDIFFLGARFDTIDVRDGAMPWDFQTRNAWLRGLKHQLGAN